MIKLRLTVCTLAFCMLLSAVIGCGEATSSIGGKVTYKGQPVQNGSITFQPTDGKGPSAGGTITAGEYRVEGITPGSKLVEILGFEAIPFARTTEELAAQAQANVQTEMADQIPADAEGNNVTIEVKPGDTTQDFNLN